MEDILDLTELAKNPNVYVSGNTMAKQFGITSGLLVTWRKTGLPYYEFGYSTYYYRPKDILDFIESKRRTSPSRRQQNEQLDRKEKPTDDDKKKRNMTILELKKTPDRLLSTKEMEVLFDISSPTLYRWRKVKLIPCYKIGGVFKYKVSDVLKYINENQI